MYTMYARVYMCICKVCQNGDTDYDKPSMIFAELHLLSLISDDQFI